MAKAIGVFTNKGLPTLLAEGGSASWKVRPDRIMKLGYIVVAQNKNDGDWGAPTHEHGQAFLLGKISGVVEDPKGRPGRSLIQFDEYAEINLPDFWHWRNPVKYLDLSDYDIEPSTLTFKSVRRERHQRIAEALTATNVKPGLDIATAKKALAEHYKVPVGAIKIIIEG